MAFSGPSCPRTCLVGATPFRSGPTPKMCEDPVITFLTRHTTPLYDFLTAFYDGVKMGPKWSFFKKELKSDKTRKYSLQKMPLKLGTKLG